MVRLSVSAVQQRKVTNSLPMVKVKLPLDSLGSPCYAVALDYLGGCRWANQKRAYFRGRWTC